MVSLFLTAAVLPFIFFSSDLTSLTLVMVLYGLAIGLHGPMAAWAADLVSHESMGTAMGVYRMVGDLGWVLGPIVLASLVESGGAVEGNPWPFLVAAIWAAVTGLLLFLAKDPAAKAGKARPVPAMP